MARVDSIQGGLSVGLVNLAAVAVLYAALGRVDGVYLGTLALGTLAAFEAVTPLALAAQNLGKELTAARRVFEIIEAEPVVRPPAESKPLPPTDRSLVMDHVTFRYGPEESYVFRDFSLDVPYGAKIAVMGPSGSGKSSLVNLLLRFWEYESGQITIGGVDLRMLDHETVRHTFGVMTQRTHLFNTTIAENIRIARDDASDEEIVRAAQAAQVHDFILSLPDGYDTFVGENGVALSGGERQRVAMARVILKDSPVWLLDEFTANLDPVTAHALMRSVLEVARARSVIAITHRVGLVDQGAFDRVVRLGNV
jgi:ATP-binding cassette subfamily C protein CydC